VARKIEFYRNYFIRFYSGQTLKVQEKIDYVLELIKQVNRIPEKFLKRFVGTRNIYEIRVEYQSNIFRIFCFFDSDNLIILLNAFQKKSQKIPKRDIDLAIRLQNEYLKQKKGKK
jgi:phage-related protein